VQEAEGKTDSQLTQLSESPAGSGERSEGHTAEIASRDSLTPPACIIADPTKVHAEMVGPGVLLVVDAACLCPRQ